MRLAACVCGTQARYLNGLTGLLPTTEQQELDDGNRQFPELDDVVQRPAPADAGQMQQAHRPDVDQGWAHRDATTTHFSHKQCNDRRCQTPSTNGNHDDGDPRHSYERVGDDIRGDPAHRTRARVHNRNNANIVNAIDDDPTGILQPCGHSACPVMLVGDDPDHLSAISYNLEITEYGDVQLPSGTAAALNGPQGKEWRAGYVKDLTAKIENGTFSYVPRPVSEKVIRKKQPRVWTVLR